MIEVGWFLHSVSAARASAYPPPGMALGVEDCTQDAVAPLFQR